MALEQNDTLVNCMILRLALLSTQCKKILHSYPLQKVQIKSNFQEKLNNVNLHMLICCHFLCRKYINE